MSPNRFLNLMFVLALTGVMAGHFSFQAKEVSAKPGDPPQTIAGCLGGQPKKLLYHLSAGSAVVEFSKSSERHLLYHRSATRKVVEPSKAATRHLLYHRSVKSCYPLAK
ncbi:MAG: hypothetical protein WCK35_04935 [Chloroflexota bacterium]